MSTFHSNWSAVAKALGLTVQNTMKTVAVELHAAITLRTPVDTGRARAGWHLSEQLESEEPGRVANVSGKKPIFISNGVPYIEALENGHSQQAPIGMVAVSVAEMEARLQILLAQEVARQGGAVA